MWGMNKVDSPWDPIRSVYLKELVHRSPYWGLVILSWSLLLICFLSRKSLNLSRPFFFLTYKMRIYTRICDYQRAAGRQNFFLSWKVFYLGNKYIKREKKNPLSFTTVHSIIYIWSTLFIYIIHMAS